MVVAKEEEDMIQPKRKEPKEEEKKEKKTERKEAERSYGLIDLKNYRMYLGIAYIVWKNK